MAEGSPTSFNMERSGKDLGRPNGSLDNCRCAGRSLLPYEFFKVVKMQKTAGNNGSTILLSVEPRDIDLFNKLLEGYDNLAMVTSIDPGIGRLALRVAENAKKDLMAILHCLPIPVSIESV